MNESQRSLAIDFEVSVPAVDGLVFWLQDQGEVFGARMTGAGFGGACVALVQKGCSREIGQRVVLWSREQRETAAAVIVPPQRAQ